MEPIWVSRYALTAGIKKLDWDGRISEHGYVFPKGMCLSAKLGVDAHITESGAKAAAEKLRIRKIASLKKTIGKLEAMCFDA